jgi:hypothetical protein
MVGRLHPSFILYPFKSLWQGIVVHPQVRAFMRCDEPFFLRQSVRLSLRILSCDEGKIVLLTAFVVTFCEHTIDSFDHGLGSSLPGSSLLSVRLAYSAVFLICGRSVAFLAELRRFENSRNVEVT